MYFLVWKYLLSVLQFGAACQLFYIEIDKCMRLNQEKQNIIFLRVEVKYWSHKWMFHEVLFQVKYL